jgi:hypothetical protein
MLVTAPSVVETIQDRINKIKKIQAILNLSKNTTISNRRIANTPVIRSRIAAEGQQEDLRQYFSTRSPRSTKEHQPTTLIVRIT